MKYMRSKTTALALLFSSVASLAGEADTVGIGNSIAESDCAWCHGTIGQGFAAAPQLAGQRREYIRGQLLSFQAHLQDSPNAQRYMWGAAARLNPQTADALAIYFSTLKAESAADGDKELAPTGELIFREGNPTSDIPSCVPCHGLEAEGAGHIPRLGGQSYHYLKSKLKQWGEGYNAATEPPMPEIARKLSAAEIDALASYLSFIK
jgi:cytochrome c553